MRKITVTVGACLAMCLASFAEMKVGTVNMVDLVRLHPNHESNRALVKSTDKDYKAKLERRQEELKSIADEAKKVFEDMQNPMLSSSAKASAQKKLEGIQQRGQTAQQELRGDIQRLQGELADLESRLLKLETDDIRAKIGQYAKENGYTLIADATMLAFSDPALDVTDDILKLMNVDPAKRKVNKDSADESK